MPSFPGGIQKMMEFMSENIKYPTNTRGCFEGTVVVSFIVEPDGEITNAEIVKSLEKNIDREALAVVEKMPLWIPGKCNGKAVRTRCVIPVRFALK